MTTPAPAESPVLVPSPDLFRALFEQAPFSIQVFAPSGETLAVNRAWERLWGLTLADLPGYSVLHDPQLEVAGIAPLLRRAAAGEHVRLPRIAYAPEWGDHAGREIWVQASAAPVRGPDGAVEHVVLIHEDVTAEVEAEERLARTRELLEEAQRSGRIGSWSWDLQTGDLTWSDETYRLFGLEPGGGVPSYGLYLAAVHPDDRGKLEAAIAEARAGRGSFAIDHRIALPTGEERVLHARGRVVADESGNPVRMTGSGQDVTERVRGAEELERLAAIVESAEDAIVGRDVDGTITSWNGGAEQLFGYRREEVLGKHIVLLVPPDRAGELPDAFERTRRGERIVIPETVRVAKDGRLLHVATTVSPVRDADGRVVGASVVVRDVSERRRLEELRRDFLAMVAHDLRSPLTAVRGYAQLLRRRGEYREAAVDAILSEAERMQRLIDDLGDVVRLDAGRLELRRAPTDLVGLAHREVAAVRERAPGHDLRVEAPAEPVVGAWDPDRLGQVVQNLVGNAVKYAPAGSVVTVRVEGGDPTRLSVRDEGPGIAPEHLPRLFERFYRAGATGTAGLGLGLYISRMIVEAHGGTITAESEPGMGSTFTATLPLRP